MPGDSRTAVPSPAPGARRALSNVIPVDDLEDTLDQLDASPEPAPGIRLFWDFSGDFAKREWAPTEEWTRNANYAIKRATH